ncbi:dipeptide ABC transporter ATP-binding protein [Nocardia bovistercoris]|uniref:ABC transporter ATP-binding protein n=1 Tax=Nocardia bovistercoris TaxID=2785916 RepID=A0A931IGY5_9NOCA|nr:ABC transporter ATP-binding protein [Nocardia bovistercoris]MBH0779560.1 ABC transporter ATP-binding protein [Nocardia bovistercoris]
MSESVPLLSVEGLTVAYRHRGRVRPTVTDVSFTVPAGKAVALVGESGSGKTTIANTVLRLAAPTAVVRSGHIRFRGEALLTARDRRLRELRGNEIAYVPQDPANSLNPVRTIGSQLRETLRVTGAAEPKQIPERVTALLADVGIARPAEVARQYPHQLSGGMLQRVLIASAIAARPALLVADEPTSALDVTVQRRVLDLVDRLRAELGLGVLLITHDLAVARQRCEELVVLEQGRVREAGPTGTVLDDPRSDYTRRLAADVPALNPDRFAAATRVNSTVREQEPTRTVIELVDVTKVFRRPGAQGSLTALDAVNLTVAAGATHAIVGESGSGKTTIARLLLGLERPTSGRVLLDGKPLADDSDAAMRAVREQIQLVYQNPFVSLDPTYSAARAVAEPLLRHGIGTRSSRARRARELLHLVGLAEHTHDSLPARLSGGQRQRVAIARALALEPRVLVLDEPTSALDVTVQARILELIVDLQRELGSTYVLISHDLGVVRQITDTVTVLRHGVVVESGSAAAVLDAPADDYTRDLIDSVPGWSTAEGRVAVPA